MSETHHTDQAHGGPNRETGHHADRPYWKRAHRDWRFYVAVFLMLGAMVVYVMSENLAFRPRVGPPQTPPSPLGSP